MRYRLELWEGTSFGVYHLEISNKKPPTLKKIYEEDDTAQLNKIKDKLPNKLDLTQYADYPLRPTESAPEKLFWLAVNCAWLEEQPRQKTNLVTLDKVGLNLVHTLLSDEFWNCLVGSPDLTPLYLNTSHLCQNLDTGGYCFHFKENMELVKFLNLRLEGYDDTEIQQIESAKAMLTFIGHIETRKQTYPDPKIKPISLPS